MPSRLGHEPESNPSDPEDRKIDTSQPYDIYCWERAGRIVVYRNARFKGTRELDPNCEFMVIEQSDGEAVFVQRPTILKFCKPGTKVTAEEL